MPNKELKCPSPGCTYVTEDLEESSAVEVLKLHASLSHGNTCKPEKPKRPSLVMSGEVIENGVWQAFKHQFATYKSLANISGQAANHLLECLAPEVYKVLFDTYGEALSQMSEESLLNNLEHLIVQKRNRLVTIMDMMTIKQDGSQKVLQFLAQVKAKARLCSFTKKCSCGRNVDYTEDMVLCRLVSGIYDQELQEDLLKVENLTLTEAEKLAVAKESAKCSQVDISSEHASHVKSQYSKDKITAAPKCNWCGGNKHSNRSSECKAYNQECKKCGKNGHFSKVCKSKVKLVKKDLSEPQSDKDEEHNNIFSVAMEESLSHISTGDLYWDKSCKRWIQRPVSCRKTEKLTVSLQVCKDGSDWLGHPPPTLSKVTKVDTLGVADTGCSVLCAGDVFRSKLKIPRSCLVKSNVVLRTADGKRMTVLGVIPVIVSIPGTGKSSKQMLHIVEELTNLFLSKLCLSDLGSISNSFPLPEEAVSMLGQESDGPVLADCGCLRRMETPSPPDLPFEATVENIPKLREFIVDYYNASTMNLCPHQVLPEMHGPPLHYTLKPDAVPHVVHTPATIPVHWGDTVKAQIDRDVELGILTPVLPNEPTVWQTRMVVVKKQNGTPRRTVDLQKLNESTIRQSHPLLSPYQKAMTVPRNSYKTVTDAWEGYHGIPLDQESSKLTQFITPWGAYRYLRTPQGWHSSGDAYCMRFDKITEKVSNTIKQVDDSLLYEQDIATNFKKTCEYLSLCGRHGILQNPSKFQFCQKEVTWSGFVIGEDFVRPMDHITSAIRTFPTPANKTDLRSYMALVQQVSYAVAVAPQLLPFRGLLKKDVKWEWTTELENLFLRSRSQLATKVEDGMKSFDPSRPTALISDFCKNGVGFVLMQKHCDCPLETNQGRLNALCCKVGWRCCMVGSRFTQDAETRYYPTEGELLAVNYALHKTKYFTLGCPSLYVGTDHKPLVGLMENSDLDSIDNPRLVKLKEKTFGWNFKIAYIPGKLIGGSDALSRYGVREDNSQFEDGDYTLRKHLIALLATNDDEYVCQQEDEYVLMSITSEKPVTWTNVKSATVNDPNMQSLINIIEQNSFPASKTLLPSDLQQFWTVRMDLRVFDGVVLYGERIVIPVELRRPILSILHSAHQGVSSMMQRACSAVYWPKMYEDIRRTRDSCGTCNSTAPSQSNMPPVTPEIPCYPFQHVSTDYFQLHNQHFLVVVDRYSGWFCIYNGNGGASWLVSNFVRLFQDVGIPETITSDGGPQYTSEEFRECLKKFGVHHRLSSVGFPHGNCRAEVAVKTAKRLLRAHVNATGSLNTVAITRALLQHRNTPDRDIGMSPAELLFGRKLKDYLPSRPNEPPYSLWPSFRDTWKNTARWRELALAKRSARMHDRLNEHVKDLKPLKVNDAVMIQNQLGNNPKRWDRRGVVIEVLPHRQYKIRMDGSRRISLRNRQFLRKYEPLNIAENDAHRPVNMPVEAPVHHTPPIESPAVEPIPEVPHLDWPEKDLSDLPDLPTLMYSHPNLDCSTANDTVTNPSHNEPTPLTNVPAPGRITQSPTVSEATPVEPGGGVESTPVLRRSSRATRSQTTRYQDYVTGPQYDQETNVDSVCSIGSFPNAPRSMLLPVLQALPLPPGFENVAYVWNGYYWETWSQ